MKLVLYTDPNHISVVSLERSEIRGTYRPVESHNRGPEKISHGAPLERTFFDSFF